MFETSFYICKKKRYEKFYLEVQKTILSNRPCVVGGINLFWYSLFHLQMRKKLVEKRIELFKQTFPDCKLSEKGNLYVRVGEYTSKKKYEVSGFGVTKNTLHKLGSKVEFEQKLADKVYLISPTGKFLIRDRHSPKFKTVSIKNVDNEIKDIFFVGRKYEYLKDHPLLWKYRYFQNFNSLAEARKHLGFGFINDEDFCKMFGPRRDHDYLTPMILAEDKSNCFNLLKGDKEDVFSILVDYIAACRKLNWKIDIPAGKNKLHELHDNAIIELQKDKADDFSKDIKFVGEDLHFEKHWQGRGVVFERIETPYDMFLTGLTQKHCIGTNYYNKLGIYSFYSIFEGESSYQIQIKPEGDIIQFKGKNNKSVPDHIKTTVCDGINFEHKIKQIPGEFDGYPRKYSVDIYEDRPDF